MSLRADQTARRVVRLLEALSSMQRAQTERLRRASEGVDRLERVQALRERGEGESGEGESGRTGGGQADCGQSERGGNGRARAQPREHGQGKWAWERWRGSVEAEP